MVSSRKQKNVDAAVNTLKSENLDVAGIVCHVAKSEDRSKLVEEVSYCIAEFVVKFMQLDDNRI